MDNLENYCVISGATVSNCMRMQGEDWMRKSEEDKNEDYGGDAAKAASCTP